MGGGGSEPPSRVDTTSVSYCQTADVIARAGRFGKAWSETSTPSYDDVETIARARASEIDACLAGRGIAVPVGGIAALSLRSLNAAGTLISLLGASALGVAADAVQTLFERVEKEWDEGLQMLRDGTHPAVVAIEATETEAGDGTADDFWSDEPEYGMAEWVDPNQNPYLGPDFQKGEIL